MDLAEVTVLPLPDIYYFSGEPCARVASSLWGNHLLRRTPGCTKNDASWRLVSVQNASIHQKRDILAFQNASVHQNRGNLAFLTLPKRQLSQDPRHPGVSPPPKTPGCTTIDASWRFAPGHVREPSQPNESLLLHQAQVSRLGDVSVPAFGNLDLDGLPLGNQADPRSRGLLIAVHPLRLFVSPAATAPVKHAGTVLLSRTPMEGASWR